MPIDTLKAVRRLQEDDTFSPEQAERVDRAEDERQSIKEQLTNRFEVRIAKLERRLPVGNVPAVAAVAALLNDLMGSRCRAA